MLDNREISLAFWLALLLAWGFSKASVRKAGVGVLKAALHRKIVSTLGMMTAYITLTVLGLRALNLWSVSDLKGTVLWASTAALTMVFDVNSIPDDDRYFRKALRDGLTISVVLEFIANLYVFHFAVELVLIPIAAALTCMLVVAESKEEFKSVRTFLNRIIALLGLGLLAYSVRRIYLDFDSFAQGSTLTEFLLPIVLSALFLPFLYLLATLVSYENLFVRLQFFMNDRELRRSTKIQLIRHFGLNFRGVNRWAKRLIHDRLGTNEEILASIRSLGTDG